MSVGDGNLLFNRNCEADTKGAVEGEVEGTLPPWLQGRLVRNGPGAIRVGPDHYRHLFDGLALLHMVQIKDGKAFYTSRFLESDAYTKNMRANRIIVTEYGTAGFPDPCLGLYGRFMSMFTPVLMQSDKMTDNCLVNVLQVKDELIAMTETNTARIVDPATLGTKEEKYNYSDYCAVSRATAHPHVDPDGTVYNLGSTVKGGPPAYAILALPEGRIDKATIVAKVPCRWKLKPGYLHSFGITENYFLICETPMCLDVLKMAYSKCAGDTMMFDKSEKTLFRIVSRKTGQEVETKYIADAFFNFHYMNCYEKNGCIIIDTCVSDDNLIEMLELANLHDMTNPNRKTTKNTPRRYILPLKDINKAATNKDLLADLPEAKFEWNGHSSKATAKKLENGNIFISGAIIADVMMELPRINYKYNTKPYQYSYGVHNSDYKKYMLNFDGITKLNMCTGELKIWSDERYYASEPIFVEKPNAETEDDGVILSLILHKTKPRELALIVLDAKDLQEVCRVNFKAEGAVTGTFHGQFIASDSVLHSY